jgi:hypothetical protein
VVPGRSGGVRWGPRRGVGVEVTHD